ncbi:MAG TPA: hypothetical protein VMU61_11865 [Candidatus Aquilonibacter sp.]|nr:hypothetical protein [Candidatus Aquilonibacter sp.]
MNELAFGFVGVTLEAFGGIGVFVERDGMDDRRGGRVKSQAKQEKQRTLHRGSSDTYSANPDSNFSPSHDLPLDLAMFMHVTSREREGLFKISTTPAVD